jgi:hypothetical protein
MKQAVLSTLDSRQEVWSEHVQEVFAQLEIPSGTLADNLAASISMYCRKFHPEGLQSRDLNLLIARAFCAVGDRAAAAHVLESMEPHRRHICRWLEILSELHHFPLLLPYFSTGIIRPADWAGAQLDRMWMLDFSRITLAEAERHEMMLYRTVRAMLEKIFVFWDATAGEGILGLKGLALLNVEEGVPPKQTVTAAADLLEYVADLFKQQVAARSWATTPSLLNLDL